MPLAINWGALHHSSCLHIALQMLLGCLLFDPTLHLRLKECWGTMVSCWVASLRLAFELRSCLISTQKKRA